MRPQEPLSRHTTLRIGGPADALAFPADVADLQGLLQYAATHGIPCYILGQGSNVLAPDEGIRGWVINIARATDWVRFAGPEVEVGSGYSLPRLVQEAARQALSGLESLAGVPGSVGGALCMNAGTGGRGIGDVTVQVQAVDGVGRMQLLTREELAFSYRTSRLQAGDLVALSARLVLDPGDRGTIEDVIRKASQKRRATQPLEYPNAGSIFKNPPGDFAGRLIEEAGCKGWQVGNAQVSPQHANFIVNLGGARAADVLQLMAAVHHRVRELFGIPLEPEVRLLGAAEGTLGRWLGAGGPLDDLPGPAAPGREG